MSSRNSGRWGTATMTDDEWAMARETALERDEFECQFCGMAESIHYKVYDAGLQVHHIVPRRFGGTHAPENLITVCRSCHGTVESVTRQLLGVVAKTRGFKTATETAGRAGGDAVEGHLRAWYDEVAEVDYDMVDEGDPIGHYAD